MKRLLAPTIAEAMNAARGNGGGGGGAAARQLSVTPRRDIARSACTASPDPLRRPAQPSVPLHNSTISSHMSIKIA